MNLIAKTSSRRIPIGLILAGLALLIVSIGLTFQTGTAAAQSPLHPTFPFLDQEGENVLASGRPVSTMQTCGQCHDTAFIASHSFHADAGYTGMTTPGDTSTGRPWDTSEGLYGKWNPITYRLLSPAGDEDPDLTARTWLQTIGLRHTGGGPAEELGVEMNCFLCHLSNPDNEARTAALQQGDYVWANTATLLSSGIVTEQAGEYLWNQDAFDEAGDLLPAFLSIQDPDNQNCGQCHGTVHDEPQPLVLTGCEQTGWETTTTGMVFSAQRISDSGMNLDNKAALTRSWDVHMERLVECTDCHFSLNNPVYVQGSGVDSLDNLEFDPRRLEIGEYLYRPVHEFARGQSAQSSLAPEFRDSLRRCESCHNTEATHDWLPYASQHLDAIHCETCHIPAMYSPAIQQVDWTVVELDAFARTTCRGIEGETGTIADMVTGFSPALLLRENLDGSIKLAPYNLISAWYWVAGDPGRPVSQELLAEAFLQGDGYHADVIALLDGNNDGVLSSEELALDTEEKAAAIAARLSALGLVNPRIQAEIQPYSINHNVAGSEWALRDCTTCHTEDSRLTADVQLAAYVPGGVLPEFLPGNNALTNGELLVDETGALVFQSDLSEEGVYIFGHNNVGWIDWLGGLMVLGVLAGVTVHGGLRAWTARRRSKHETRIEKIYMYSFYERVWHWLQTLTILILAFTGLVIHKPESFGIFNFNGVVLVHNIMAALLVANAALALFHNLVSGDIKRFLPEPRGFFNQSFEQARYYISGIFKGEPHPFERTRQSRLNPLQKVTYFGILNVLLPLQVITGILMWGVQRWPQVAGTLGGLPFLAPFHTLISWSFVAFIIAHVYLTTTGHTPITGIKSMIVGWDEVEVHPSETETTEEN
jgi:thiosulfate reductase cytochrome b subunit